MDFIYICGHETSERVEIYTRGVQKVTDIWAQHGSGSVGQIQSCYLGFKKYLRLSNCGRGQSIFLLLVCLMLQSQMCTTIENPFTFEARSVFKFLLAKNCKPIEIHCQFCKIYGNRIMSEFEVRQRCIGFKNATGIFTTRSAMISLAWSLNTC